MGASRGSKDSWMEARRRVFTAAALQFLSATAGAGRIAGREHRYMVRLWRGQRFRKRVFACHPSVRQGDRKFVND
jgi:hypothetical protein